MSDVRITIDAQIQVRRDTEANWISVDPVLRDGEIAYSKDVKNLKIGDGASHWSELDYLATGGEGGGIDEQELERYLQDNGYLKDANLSDYAKTADVTTSMKEINGSIKNLADLLSSMWHLDENGNIVTDKQVIIKNNAIINADLSFGGNGEGGGGGLDESQLQDYLDLHKYITEDALSSYYTKSQSDARYLALSGNGMLSFDGAGRPVMLNNQGYAAYNTNGQIEEVMWLDSSNLLQLGGTTSQKVNIYGELTINYQDAIHSGNIGSYAFVPKSDSLASNVNADNYLSNGAYLNQTGDGSGNSNFPQGYAMFLTFTNGQPNYVTQLDLGRGNAYYRTKIDTWSDWKQFITSDNIGSQSVASAKSLVASNGTTYVSYNSTYGQVNVNGSIALQNLYSTGALFMNNGSEGIYVGGSQIHWHNSSNAYAASLINFSATQITIHPNVVMNGFAESAYNRNSGISASLPFTDFQWRRVWQGGYGSAVRLQIGKNYYHMQPNVLCVDVSVGYNTASIVVTSNSDAGSHCLHSIRVTQDSSGNYYIDVLLYNSVANTDKYIVCGNSAGGDFKAFVEADNTATVLEQISVVPNASIISNNLIVSGDFSFGSDMRYKDVINNKTLKIEDIADAPLFTFKWNNKKDDTLYLGSSAQYWEKIAPWLVSGSDFKSLNYATLGVAMGISLAKKAVNHEERIKILEAEIKRLKREQYGN